MYLAVTLFGNFGSQHNIMQLIKSIFMFITDIYTVGMWLEIMQPDLGKS